MAWKRSRLFHLKLHVEGINGSCFGYRFLDAQDSAVYRRDIPVELLCHHGNLVNQVGILCLKVGSPEDIRDLRLVVDHGAKP